MVGKGIIARFGPLLGFMCPFGLRNQRPFVTIPFVTLCLVGTAFFFYGVFWWADFFLLHALVLSFFHNKICFAQGKKNYKKGIAFKIGRTFIEWVPQIKVQCHSRWC